jgi:glycine C-acetyltransferase
LDQLNINYGNPQSQIFAVLFKDEIETNNAVMLQLDHNIFINPITYPAVPKKRSWLRVSILAMHTKKQLDRLLHILHTIKNADKENKNKSVN